MDYIAIRLSTIFLNFLDHNSSVNFTAFFFFCSKYHMPQADVVMNAVSVCLSVSNCSRPTEMVTIHGKWLMALKYKYSFVCFVHVHHNLRPFSLWGLMVRPVKMRTRAPTSFQLGCSNSDFLEQMFSVPQAFFFPLRLPYSCYTYTPDCRASGLLLFLKKKNLQ